ncbi:N-acetylmuramoyl-L-alanine amidase domain containing protein [uncultured Caudovirales phage]|uniref:N-acetylmuramoyl-L-alanine amidase domain containing protein n=1 Tax=uncultured Caudovirales phage TaxID=2100421 RepID=A0A6J5N490_9CAUD|nr:N-acetylmuramoyl-L-alanine amidase domain containing protein [uncultured Caudovirales phage]
MDIEFIPANRNNYFTAQEAQGYYGLPRTVDTIVIHHWGDPNDRPTFASNLNYLLDAPNGYPSANCVIGLDESTNTVRIVDTVRYPDVAFTSGGSINAKSVAIECDPLAETSNGFANDIYKAIGYRVWQWRTQLGWRVPLSRHSDYFSTACPGAMDLGRIDAEADKWANGGYNPKPTPTPTIKFTKLPVPKIYVCKLSPTTLWRFNVSKWSEFEPQSVFSLGSKITVFGYADHPLGARYLMTQFSFGNADATGTPDHYWGFNEKDMVEYVEPTPEPVPPTPEPTPPDPTPEPPVPTPTPEYPNWFVSFWIELWESIKNILHIK